MKLMPVRVLSQAGLYYEGLIGSVMRKKLASELSLM